MERKERAKGPLSYYYDTIIQLHFQFVRLRCNISEVNCQTDAVRFKKNKISVSWTEFNAQAGGIRYLVQFRLFAEERKLLNNRR